MAGEKIIPPKVHYYFAMFCFLFSMSSLMLLPFFLLNFLIPITVDSKPSWNTLSIIPSSPLLNNVLLMAIFFVQHSGMARMMLKTVILRYFPNGFEKSFYTLASGVSLYLMYICWLPMVDYELWRVGNQWIYYGVIALNFLCCFALVKTTAIIKDIDIHGVKTAEQRMEGKSKSSSNGDGPKKLLKIGVYQYIRHPLMSLQIIIMSITPVMTAGHALLSGLMILYIISAVIFLEEPALIKEFGEEYKQYMKEVPRFIPDLRKFF